jgi:carboxyl-terminal processing protease
MLDVDRRRSVLYLRLRYFSSAATTALASALRAGEVEGVDGYLIDLRDNPGGVLEEAVASAAMLLPCGDVVAETRRGGIRPEYSYRACSLPPAQFDAVPPIAPGAPRVAVLINGGSASSAEVFTSALRDNGRGRLFGSRSFGKARVQFFFPLGDGFGGLKLTVKTWTGPRGRSVERGTAGILPDVECRAPPAPLDEQPDGCTAVALRYLVQS